MENLIRNEHVTASWLTIKLTRQGEMKKILVVETRLSLNEDADDYDPTAITSVTDSIGAYFDEHRSIDEAELVGVPPAT